jgi:hypothetical protein
MIKQDTSLFVPIAVNEMKPFLIIGGIHTEDKHHRNIIMMLQADDIDDAIDKIDRLIKLVTKRQKYKIVVGESGTTTRFVLNRSVKEQSYIEIKEIVDNYIS